MYILDKRLSLKAKGLLTVLLELQEAKKPLMPYSVYPTSDRDITINSAMMELRKYSYVGDVIEYRGTTAKPVGIQAFRYPQE